MVPGVPLQRFAQNKANNRHDITTAAAHNTENHPVTVQKLHVESTVMEVGTAAAEFPP
jgi:hypothetical protein